MANTFEEYRGHMNWSMLDDELTDWAIKELYDSVDKESYVSFHDVEEDYETAIVDVNLHSVLEYFSELLTDEHRHKLMFYYVVQEDMYVGVIHY